MKWIRIQNERGQKVKLNLRPKWSAKRNNGFNGLIMNLKS